MPEVLSQAEIDALLTAVSTGQIKPEEAAALPTVQALKRYDFRRPNKFTKDQLRTLQILHENLARILSGFLSGYLRTNVSIAVSSVEQFTFDDFSRSLPMPTLLTIFSLSPLKGMAVMETNPHFLFPVIDLLFGGPGDVPKKVRELTSIEISVAKKINAKILENLSFAWSDVFSVTPEIETVETNPRFQQVISPSEVVVVITFSTVVGTGARGYINLCLPHVTLEPVLVQLSSYYHTTPAGLQEDSAKKELEYWINQVPVDLAVVAGETEIAVREFLNLQVGDVLPLDRGVNADLDVYVSGQLRYKAQAGTVGRYLAVQITSLAEGGEFVG
ncbi:MAG: flagellar motor switch protein FliM [Bacillota bacterium]|jgi:flagellar motor switch protein FliM|nr:flagellar motor switch protein FliM [Thermoanaerobacteraceae bacterium]